MLLWYVFPVIILCKGSCISKIATRPPFRDFSTDSSMGTFLWPIGTFRLRFQQLLLSQQLERMNAQLIHSQQQQAEQQAALIAAHRAEIEELQKGIAEAKAAATSAKAPDSDNDEVTGAAPVSRVCQVFGPGQTLPFPPSLGFCECLLKSDQPPRSTKSKSKIKRLIRHMTVSVRRLYVL